MSFNSVKSWLSDVLNQIQQWVLVLLPDSFIKDLEVPSNIKAILSNINWVIPFYMIGNTLLVWCGCIAVYYAYQIILRWIKAIQ